MYTNKNLTDSKFYFLTGTAKFFMVSFHKRTGNEHHIPYQPRNNPETKPLPLIVPPYICDRVSPQALQDATC